MLIYNFVVRFEIFDTFGTLGMCWSFPTTLSAIPWRTGRYSHRIHTKVLGNSFIFQLQLWVSQSCFSQLWTIWGWVFWMTPTYCPHKSKTFGFRNLNVSAAETITKTHKRVRNWCATESWFINPWQSYILVKERKQRRAVNLRSSTNWFGRLWGQRFCGAWEYVGHTFRCATCCFSWWPATYPCCLSLFGISARVLKHH